MKTSYVIKPEIDVLGEYGLFYPGKALVTFYSSPFGFLENFFIYFTHKRAVMENKKIIAISINEDLTELLDTHMFLHKYNIEFLRLIQRGLIQPVLLANMTELLNYLEEYNENSSFIYILQSDVNDLLSYVRQLRQTIKKLMHKWREQLLITLFLDHILLQKEEWLPIRYLSDVEFVINVQEPLNSGEITINRVKMGVKPGYKINFQVTNDFISYQVQLKT